MPQVDLRRGTSTGGGGSSDLVRVSASEVTINTSQLSGGTNYSNAASRAKLDLAGNPGFPAAYFNYPNGGSFIAGEVSVFGTNDVFFQAFPSSGAGYGYLESWSGAGMVLGTGNATPVYIRPNRTTQWAFSPDGTLYGANTSTPGTPGGGGYLYVEGGALKYKGSSGTVTVIAPA